MTLITACTTPYRPPVVVHGAQSIPGLVSVVQASQGRPVDVILVHGMCTHDIAWAGKAIELLVGAIDSSVNVLPQLHASDRMNLSITEPAIQVIKRAVPVAGGTLHFSALLWSPLTTRLKQQLAFDKTGEPTDCSVEGVCRPIRAHLNGELKDDLMNDCLADALVYQGVSHRSIVQKMVKAVSDILEDSRERARAAKVEQGPLVLITESLGSKMAYDALSELAKTSRGSSLDRISLIFMGANQLPILGLAEQDVARDGAVPAGVEPSVDDKLQSSDSLRRLLSLRRSQLEVQGAKVPEGKKKAGISAINIVAFTDPNDLLSYRLRASRYAEPGVVVSDVLVSNNTTYFEYFARPDTAHTEYATNQGVTSIIACGYPKSPRCK